MKAIHWAKLPAPALSQSLWATADLAAAEVDRAATEALFAMPQPKPRPDPLSRKGSAPLGRARGRASPRG